MALTFTPRLLSGSTNGLFISVTATGSPGQAIHTVQATTTDSREEIRLIIYNDGTASQPIVIEFGATEVGARIRRSLQNREAGLTQFGPFPLTATTSIVRCYTTGTASSGAVRVIGQVNRAT